MGTCSRCGKADIGDSGFCFKHGGRVTVTAVTYNHALMPEDGGTTINADFLARAQEALYKKAIDNFVIKGPGASKKPETVNGVSVNHDTNGAGTGNHASVFWRWNGTTMQIYGLGFHPGTDLNKYSILWFDGTTINYTRPRK